MNSLVSRYASSSAIIRRDVEGDDAEDVGDAMWGSAGGFAVGAKGVPSFVIPRVPDVSSLIE
jgi:20S proteasome subunit beta 5